MPHDLSGVVLAGRVGFEPTRAFETLLIFETSTFNHSVTSPRRGHYTTTCATGAPPVLSPLPLCENREPSHSP
jgi:hypothetical protein